MKILIKYTNLDSTSAIDAYINEKIGGLEKFIQSLEKNNEVIARVEISHTTKHHQKGPVHRAEVNLDFPGYVLRAEKEDWDIRIAIDQVRDALQREIKKYKEKRQSQENRGQAE